MGNNTAISVEKLSIGYASKKKSDTILSNISFQIPKGKLVGIIGANGTGKSTLLRTLAHQQTKLSGNISIQEKALEDYSVNDFSQQVSWVHTETLIPKSLSVLELVALGRQPYTNWLDTLNPKDLEKIKEVILLTDLTKIQHKKCTEISDGQLQRVFIARAIAQDTPIIFLDEPTTHLDLHHKVETLTLLKKLCTTFHKTIVFSSHEIELCLQVCDKILSISNKKVALNSPKALIETSILDDLFQNSSLFFDKELMKFRID